MDKLCRQISIDSPGTVLRDCVLNINVPVPETPPNCVRVKVVYAGACYRRNRASSLSICSSLSGSSEIKENLRVLKQTILAEQFGPNTASTENPTINQQHSPNYHGYRDSALFPGFEVAGVIDTLGINMTNCEFKIGQRVVLYPSDDVPDGYAEYIVVSDLKNIIPIPDNLLLSVAAMLPTGALLAMNAIHCAQEIVTNLLNERNNYEKQIKCNLLIVGTGGLALWAVRIAAYYFAKHDIQEHIKITVATLRDEGLMLTKDFENIGVVQWNEDLYEKQLIERTIDACGGNVDIVINFGSTSRNLHRSLQCLTKDGVVLVAEETAENLLLKFFKLAEERQQKIQPVTPGSIEQLNELIKLISSKEIEPPPYSVFPCEEASEVVNKLSKSQIPGRAILKFHDIE